MRAASLLPMLFLLLSFSGAVLANQGQYKTRDQLLEIAFPTVNGVPIEYKMETLWLTKEIKQTAENILGHPLNILRVRYWKHANRTVWILDEIGKIKPITTGVIIENASILSLHILAFRESRGWEVKYPFFTDQFLNIALNKKSRLDKNIDGITGATLSVRAVSNVARLALYFHTQTDL
ncbi:MAG: FMN-binding protein [Pseudomonadales bacterium]|nr:FMN-binding protein [Pseudomonadales bacterium]